MAYKGWFLGLVNFLENLRDETSLHLVSFRN